MGMLRLRAFPWKIGPLSTHPPADRTAPVIGIRQAQANEPAMRKRDESHRVRAKNELSYYPLGYMFIIDLKPLII
jgi:hypothetical protein